MELVTLKIKDLLPSTKLILSKFFDSKHLSAKKNENNQLVFRNNTDSRYGGQAYLNFILDPETNYVLQINLEQQQGQEKWFVFGLMKDSNKDSILGEFDNLSYWEYKGSCGINTLIKGQPILTDEDDLTLESRSLEVRINIGKKILRVGSLPNYDSVVEADQPERIDAATPYRFFLFGLHTKTKMTIVKLETVSQFDSAM